MDKKKQIYEEVKKRYGSIAKESSCCSTEKKGSCCSNKVPENYSLSLGYNLKDLQNAPNQANLNLGCGNPTAIASLKKGEKVLDLGAGAGLDCFLAANQVGEKGYVIGLDMTEDMIKMAKRNASNSGYKNVEFKLGNIEKMPVNSNTIDVIISNCVINLSPEKQTVYNEAFRVLKPGGRIAISDIVVKKELPEEIKMSVAHYTGCISGASTIKQLTAMLDKSGFQNIKIEPKENSEEYVKKWADDFNIEDYILSAYIQAIKPE